jgi:hypothetical protein
MDLGFGTLRVENGALASAKEIVVGTTRGYGQPPYRHWRKLRVTSNYLSVGTTAGSRSTVSIEDGAVLPPTPGTDRRWLRSG